MAIMSTPKSKIKLAGYSLTFKIMVLFVTGTVGALALMFVLFQWQDWSADQADLASDQLRDARNIAAAASMAVETRGSGGHRQGQGDFRE